MTTAWVTVVIPTKARPVLLAEAVESVRRQTFRKWECVIAVDGHDAETQRYLVSLCGDDLRFRFVSVQNGGSAARVRNAAIERVTTPFLALLDDDDMWLDHKLAIQHAVFVEHPNTVLSCGRIEEWGERTAIWPATEGPHLLDADFLCAGNCIATSTVVARTSSIREAGCFDPHRSLAEDYDLWLRLTAFGELRMSSAILCRYRVHQGNSSKNESLMRDEVERVLVQRFQDGTFSSQAFRRRLQRLCRERAKRAASPYEAVRWQLKGWIQRYCGGRRSERDPPSRSRHES